MYYGDYAEDATVTVGFTTHDGSGGAVAPSTPFEAADVDWYKDNIAFSPAGVVMTSPLVSTGLHGIVIDTSNDGGDNWETGSDYMAVLTPDETVDGETVIRIVIQFSIENRFMRGTDSASTHSAANVWGVGTRELTGNANLANLEVDLTKILGSALTEGTAGYLAGRFKDFLNVGSAAFNVGTALSNFKATGFSTHNAAAIWSVAARVLTANTNLANLQVDLTKIHGSALSETSGYLAGRFGDFFNHASATFDLSTALSAFKATGFSTHNAQAVWDLNSALSGTPDFGTLMERIYQYFSNRETIVDSTGAVALRTIGNGGDLAIWTISDDDTTTLRTEASWA